MRITWNIVAPINFYHSDYFEIEIAIAIAIEVEVEIEVEIGCSECGIKFL